MQATLENKAPFISLSEITKSFAGHTVLHPIDLQLHPGEFHALIGENGAGKSTLINMITGVHKPDRGLIEIDGSEVASLTPTTANQFGIYAVHQELSLCANLTIVQNIFLGNELISITGQLQKKKMREIATQLLKEVGIGDLHPDTPVIQLSLAEQQLIEFSKAVYQNPKLLVLDEATSALDPNQVLTMFNRLRELQKEGLIVVFISHRLQELFDLCDTMTVLKDGQQIVTRPIEQIDQDELISLMTGRTFSDLYPVKPDIEEVMSKKEVLVVEGLTLPNIQNLNFTLHEGEILGIGGLQGQGQQEILRSLFGTTRIISGSIGLNGQKLKLKHPKHAMKAGIAYIPADRKSEGLLLTHSIRFNISMGVLNKISDFVGTVRSKHEKETTNFAMKRMQIKAQSMEQPANALSGGNQQKVILAKWLERNPSIILLDEPTRGIDVGTKKEIYELLRTLTQSGVSIIMTSSDTLEIIGLCDRVLVMYEHQLNGALKGSELTEEKLVELTVLKK
ncbi:MAG: sugar ABC transporter ATP-binding protein [Lysinibacillus sp.]